MIPDVKDTVRDAPNATPGPIARFSLPALGQFYGAALAVRAAVPGMNSSGWTARVRNSWHMILTAALRPSLRTTEPHITNFMAQVCSSSAGQFMVTLTLSPGRSA